MGRDSLKRAHVCCQQLPPANQSTFKMATPTSKKTRTGANPQWEKPDMILKGLSLHWNSRDHFCSPG